MPDKLLSPSMGLMNNDLQKANADPGNVKAGLTFYAGDKTLKTGTLQDLGSEPKAAGGTLYNNGVYFYIGENGGQGRYIVQRGVYWDYGSVANLIGLTADKIRSGQQILGIWGNYTGGDQPLYGAFAARVKHTMLGYAAETLNGDGAWCNGGNIICGISSYFAYIGMRYADPNQSEYFFRWFNAGETIISCDPAGYYNCAMAIRVWRG